MTTRAPEGNGTWKQNFVARCTALTGGLQAALAKGVNYELLSPKSVAFVQKGDLEAKITAVAGKRLVRFGQLFCLSLLQISNPHKLLSIVVTAYCIYADMHSRLNQKPAAKDVPIQEESDPLHKTQSVYPSLEEPPTDPSSLPVKEAASKTTTAGFLVLKNKYAVLTAVQLIVQVLARISSSITSGYVRAGTTALAAMLLTSSISTNSSLLEE